MSGPDSFQTFLLGSAAAALLTIIAPHPARTKAILESVDPSASPNPNVGILAAACYFPKTYISQAELETHNGVSAGKYTAGLGQTAMSITGDVEDVNSIALTACSMLLRNFNIDPASVGRLEVGTETLIDKSKSTKTVLTQLFPGNTDIEGVTTTNACYGGTAALLNTFLWVESSGWDGRYGIVVACDIAAYSAGPARPTCGVGAVAVLVGRDAPLMFEPKLRATHACNTWDFYKPDHRNEYPVVDGALSQTCYYQALEDCYSRYADKCDKFAADAATVQSRAGGHNDDLTVVNAPFDAETPDFFVFHAPYNKLVQKSYARLYLVDARRRFEKTGQIDPRDRDLEEYLKIPVENTYADRKLDEILKKKAATSYKSRLADSNFASMHIGNTYAASVFVGICSLLDSGVIRPGQKVTVFSYGSGAMASMYSLHVRDSSSDYSLSRLTSSLQLRDRLKARELVSADELDYALNCRGRMHNTPAPYSPCYPPSRLFPNTYYLVSIDDKWRRTYGVTPAAGPATTAGAKLVPSICLRHEANEQHGVPVKGKLSALARQDSTIDAKISAVITGVAVGLPGSQDVFAADNLDKLLAGNNTITSISGSAKINLLDKNIVQTKKQADGSIKKLPVKSEADCIQLAAQLGSFSLDVYGVSKGLSETMDVAAQVAVAAGMEALKCAKLVKGGSANSENWMLPENLRDSTGVVYCSSFPAMDAAVGEVMRYLQSKTVGAASMLRITEALRNRLVKASPNRALNDEDEAALARLAMRAKECRDDAQAIDVEYVFDRKFLFRVLVLGNAQLAQLAGLRGPNTQTNAACSGTTQGIAMAHDMLVSGRAQRVVVIAGDNASGETLLPWLGAGFRALGAACVEKDVKNASKPFAADRNGLILSGGGIGIVLETESSAAERGVRGRARLLATQYSNSAYHGAALDVKHITSELDRFMNEIKMIHGISREEIAEQGVYLSHETSTHSSPTSACSFAEVTALRSVFGESLSSLLICNTKGYLGHPMGVSFEDVAAVEVLFQQISPPVVGAGKEGFKFDKHLGDLKLSTGGPYAARYALRFSAGFGSQVAFALYGVVESV
jgi:hydroxymethylglutaryl-CoA synthase